MIIDKIDDARLLISLHDDDMNAFDLDFDQFLWSDKHSRAVIRDLLDLAFAETGFNTKHQGLSIEVLPTVNGCLILFTLLNRKNRVLNKKYTVKRKENPFIYVFKALEDLLQALQRLTLMNDCIRNSSVIKYKKQYYLIIYANIGLISPVSIILNEYGRTNGRGKIKAAKIYEYGEIIADNHAIEKIGQHLN